MSNKFIKKGDEITILYLSKFKNYEARTELFKKIYNFECDCILCEIEKNSRIKFPEIMKEYNDLYYKLVRNNESIEIKNRNIKKYDKFLNKNKNFLSEFEIGKAYFELGSNATEIDEGYKYYKITEKYIKKYSFEIEKLNINKFYEFCVTLINIGEQKANKYIHEIYETLLKFNKVYFNFSKDEVDLLLDLNFEERNNEQLMNYII